MFALGVENRLEAQEALEESERREEELEDLVLEYMRGAFDAKAFAARLKRINARFDLRRAGEKLKPASS